MSDTGANGPDDLQGTIKRLSRLRRKGARAGREWARAVADAEELRRLQDLADSKGFPGWLPQVRSWAKESDGLAARLHAVLCPRRAKDEDEDNQADEDDQVSDYWETVLADYTEDADEAIRLIENPDFARGFIEAALDVWAAVRDQV